jgi:excisionase family DNA binding protein
MDEEEFLTVMEIAEKLKVNPMTVRNWISRGELAPFSAVEGG